jgi:replicative DNA helicase
LTLGGRSGSGKSMILEQMKRGFIDQNPDQDLAILSFEFEMLPKDQVFRNLSAKLDVSLKDLLSIDKKIDKNTYESAKAKAKSLADYPIYYIDTFMTVSEIEKAIYNFANEIDKKKIIVTIDHLLLTKKRNGYEEKALIDDLCQSMIEIKKNFNAHGREILIIMVSQLNRDLTSKERVINPKLHYPQENDLFGASSIFNASDYVIITQNPSRISGLGDYYGPPVGRYGLGLPVYCPDESGRPMIYHHLLKNRMGEPGQVISYVSEFSKSKIEEYTL